MDENIIKINLVETAMYLAEQALLWKFGIDNDEDLLTESPTEKGVFILKEEYRNEFDELYDYYYTLLSNRQLLEV